MPDSDQRTGFQFTGGNLCLDFCNTVDNRASPQHERDLLDGYADLLVWAQQAGILNHRQVAALSRTAAEAPGQAQAALQQALQLREAIYEVVAAVADRRGVPITSLHLLNSFAQRAAQHAEVVHSARHFSWDWIEPEKKLDSILWPIARSAAELLVSDAVAFVRQCAAEDCGWVFLDTSRNHRRRWCDMKTCGNRDKARRYYRRVSHG
jgi:predicted RNA-binding Zn ribbon-like protein